MPTSAQPPRSPHPSFSSLQRMGLLSIFKRTGEAPATPVPESADAVQQARVRARRRLIGATVLLVIGVIGFPLVFETRPRPIPVDIPIEIPRKEDAPPLAIPPARTPSPVTMPPVPQQSATEPAVITESRADAGREIATRAASDAQRASTRPSSTVVEASRAAAPASQATRRPILTPSGPEAPKATAAPVKPGTETAKAAAPAKPAPGARQAPAPTATPTPANAEAGRAQALPASKASASTASGRFVVQVGAFAEAESARETRQKVEKLGLKTYTQVAQTPSGDRIRVRIGPFVTRAEADAALAKARAAGLSPVVLTL
jgi:DedD protein